jgi:hypothetical protein
MAILSVPLLSATSKGWTMGAVTLEPEKETPDGVRPGLLSVSADDASTGDVVSIAAHVPLTKVEDSFVFNDKLVVLGQAGRAEAVVVFDLLARRKSDWFYCYQPRHIGKGWITYVEWYPGHSSAEPTDVVLAYDLALSPMENRLAKENDITLPPRLNDSPSRVGFPIYPASNAQQKSYVNRVASLMQAEHILGSPLLLLASDKLVIPVRFQELSDPPGGSGSIARAWESGKPQSRTSDGPVSETS